MTCCICDTRFGYRDPADTCDCGANLLLSQLGEGDSLNELCRRWEAIKRGELPCDDCDEVAPLTTDFYGVSRCATCQDNHEANQAEAAHERRLEDYYGGSGPVTLAEHLEAARRGHP